MTKSEVLRLQDHYKFPNHIHVYAPELDNQVTSGLSGHLIVYQEFFHAILRFSFHPFILNILDLFGDIPAQLAPDFFHLLCSFLVLCNMLGMHPPISLFILNILDLFWVILAQLTPNSFHLLCSFLVLYNMLRMHPSISLF